MNSGESSEGKLYERLSVISNEVIDVKGVLRKVGSIEEDVKNLLAEIASVKDSLISRVSGLEAMVKDAVAGALEEAERDEETKGRLERERADLEREVTDRDTVLSAKDVIIQKLEESLRIKRQELEGRIEEKKRIVEIRDTIVKNFQSAASSLNTLVEELTSLGRERVEATARVKIKDSKKRVAEAEPQEETETPGGFSASEIESLRAEIKRKDTLISTKEIEFQNVKREMESRMQDLKNQLDRQVWNQRSSRSWRSFGKSR